MDRAFDIVYHNDRLGVPCVKSHRFIAESKEKAIEGYFSGKARHGKTSSALKIKANLRRRPGLRGSGERRLTRKF